MILTEKIINPYFHFDEYDPGKNGINVEQERHLAFEVCRKQYESVLSKLKVDDEGLVKPYNPCNDCHFYIKEPNEIRYTCHRKIGICTEFRQYEGAFVQYSSDNKKLSYLSRRIQDKDNEIERLKNELTHIKQQHPEDNW